MTVVHSSKKLNYKRLFIKIIFAGIILNFLIFATFEVLRFNMNNSRPDNLTSSLITDVKLKGTLELFHHRPSASYWLYYNTEDDENLVMFLGEMKGSIEIQVIDDEVIEITRNYQSSPEEPLYVSIDQLDLSKNDTINVSILYKLLK